jgi:polar amino acid transport system substrate-binding protein
MRTMTYFKMFACAVSLSWLCAGAAAADPLRVGTTPAGPPFTFVDPATGKSEGVMIDVMKAIAKDNNLQIDTQAMQFATLVPALVSDKIDIVSAAMMPTPARQRVVDFSSVVYQYGEGLVVRASDTKQYHSIQDMKGMTVGAVTGTIFYDTMVKSGVFKQVKAYDSTAELFSDVAAGRLDAMFGDNPVVKYRFAHSSYPTLRYVADYQPVVTNIGIAIAVRKNNGPLLQQINTSLEKMKADGRMDAILKKWNL